MTDPLQLDAIDMRCGVHGRPKDMDCDLCGGPVCRECAEFVEGGWLCRACARKERDLVLIRLDPHYGAEAAPGGLLHTDAFERRPLP